MLVVEDNLFIALDAEDMLRGLGVRTIDIAKSVREALEMLEANAYGCALVDVNLGQEISLPVARRLRERGIPFLFGTGYGDHKSMDESLKDIAIVSKPYHEKAMGLALTRLLRQQPGRGGGGQGDGGQGDSGQADSGQGEAGQTPPNA